ncbi:serine O-acetyltransferase [Alkalilimnicola ehrlichii]|uniref:Serine acetyltransferase n=1 Tax=Alkalilimnicola ehrlichii TaxID=351052 RepID=A0A3E0X2E4_9GAMM|nr:serine O-acetyltransferase [Alkalilimnicola ehrlichii]RFA28411.1 serine O-acetyltransferase [Alkalilimnicola ehrlichii]RFA38522.1 serine O-acetyltransferase [Alkalilimnicola ehrlichii]
MSATQCSTWRTLRDEVELLAQEEAILASYLQATVINHSSLEASLSYLLANKLSSPDLPAMSLREIVAKALFSAPEIQLAVRSDLAAAVDRDPAVQGFAAPFLNHKGFHALQAHRVAHWYWRKGRLALALYLQSSISEAFSVDIHPAAVIGRGVFMDHATAVVIGETAVVGDDVSILQGVTLGGTGKDTGDRHPKVGRGVLLSAGAKVLGNIRLGACSKIGAGSVVLADVPPYTTVAGVPARVVGQIVDDSPALRMNQQLEPSG